MYAYLYDSYCSGKFAKSKNALKLIGLPQHATVALANREDHQRDLLVRGFQI